VRRWERSAYGPYWCATPPPAASTAARRIAAHRARVLARDGAAALVHVDAPPERALPPAAPISRTRPNDHRLRRRRRPLPPSTSSGSHVVGVRCTTGADPTGIYGAEVGYLPRRVDGHRPMRVSRRIRCHALRSAGRRPVLDARFPARQAALDSSHHPRLSFWGSSWQLGGIDVLAPPRESPDSMILGGHPCSGACSLPAGVRVPHATYWSTARRCRHPGHDPARRTADLWILAGSRMH
jgi:hypothetical protein